MIGSKINVHLLKMVQCRGPDSTVVFENHEMCLAFHRLAIHDLSWNGNQPFVESRNGWDYFLLCNGEIYNAKELESEFFINPKSTSDCAILLPLFLHFEEEFGQLLRCIQGEFALCIIKQRQDEFCIWIGSDPLCVRPLFYMYNEKVVGISSLLKGLCEGRIERLHQGEWIQWKRISKKFEMTKWNHLPIVPTQIDDLCNVSLEMVNIVEKCVIRRLQSERPIGCLLSGGLDSSLVAAIAAKHLWEIKKERLKTFSIGMKDGTDLKFARDVATHIGSDHVEFHFTKEEGIEVIPKVVYMTETFDITTIRASIGQFLLGKKIKETSDIKVLLNGDGADECQMGYLYFYLAPSISEAVHERNRLVRDIHLFDGLRVDRNLSNHGLEARVPFLDSEFVMFCLSLDPSLLVPTSERMEKYFIRKAFETYRPDLLPFHVLWRKKEAFSDGVSSIQQSWFSILHEYYKGQEEEAYLGLFQQYFPSQQHVIPYYWRPKWTVIRDPSARLLPKVI